jgi:hypothetical protein
LADRVSGGRRQIPRRQARAKRALSGIRGRMNCVIKHSYSAEAHGEQR